MTDKTYDVAVVGASIAGCTAATLLAREGASVAVIERNSDPDAYKALCTHFIQPSAVPTMERLGLLPLIEDAGAVPWGDEPILRDGRVVGTVTSAAFGHTLGRAVAMGYVRDPGGVDEAYVAGGRFELDVAGDRIPARAGLAAPFDPRALRV